MTHVCMYVYLARYRMESSRPTHTHCHVDPFGTRGVWSAQDLESFIAAWQLPTVRTRRMMDIAAMHRTPRIGYGGDTEAARLKRIVARRQETHRARQDSETRRLQRAIARVSHRAIGDRYCLQYPRLY
jgi:RNA polymerase-interacting CarD/CdnL/TRCF family regulator